MEEAAKIWVEEYSERKIISGFLKDKLVGSKRLISMPDRVTNTITTGDDVNPAICRPAVINCYEGDMSSMEAWYVCSFILSPLYRSLSLSLCI